MTHAIRGEGEDIEHLLSWSRVFLRDRARAQSVVLRAASSFRWELVGVGGQQVRAVAGCVRFQPMHLPAPSCCLPPTEWIGCCSVVAQVRSLSIVGYSFRS